MDSARLEKLLIREVSAVDAPANQLDGWLVMKSAPAKTGLHIAFGDDGAMAVMHDDCDQIRISKGGRTHFLSKSAVDPDAVTTPPINEPTSPPSVGSRAAHHSHRQAREQQGTGRGRFRASPWRKATGKPTLTGAQFFT